MNKYLFSEVAQFVMTKINVNTLSLEQYISTENMLPNIGGIEPITSLPTIQKCTSFKENDILFSNIRTYFKKVWIAEFDGGCSPDVLVIRSKDERVLLNKYLFLLIRSDDFINFTAMASNGAKMPRGDKKAMLKYEFNIPSIEEQKRIIKQQFTLTDKILLNTQTNQTLEQIAQAIYKSWFVDFEPTRAKAAVLAAGGSKADAESAAMRTISGKSAAELAALAQNNPAHYQQLADLAAAFPAALVPADDFGEIPAGWEVKKVGDIVERLKNKQKLSKNDISNTGTIPVFEQGSSLLMGYHNGNAAFDASIDNPIFIFGDHTCITLLTTEPFSIYQNVIPLKGKELPSYWVYYAIMGKQKFQEYRRHWMEFIVKDVIVPNNTYLCNAFSEKIKYLFQMIDRNRSENKYLMEIRDTILPKLINR